MNVWTHFAAAVWFILQWNSVSARVSGDGSLLDLFAFRFFLIGVFLCFGVSSLYHALSNHSEAVHDKLLRWDLRCISVLIVSCYYPA